MNSDDIPVLRKPLKAHGIDYISIKMLLLTIASMLLVGAVFLTLAWTLVVVILTAVSSANS